MEYSLSDANSALRTFVEQTHRFWGYFQLVSGAVLTLAFVKDQSASVAQLLAVGYALFAFFNGRLVEEAQSAAHTMQSAIRRYVEDHPAVIPTEFSKVHTLYTPQDPVRVRVSHAALVLAVLAVLAARIANLS